MILQVRKILQKIYVWSYGPVYGCGTWTTGSEEKRKLEAFEMWCYQKMFKIKWTEKIINEAALNRVKEKREIGHHNS